MVIQATINSALWCSVFSIAVFDLAEPCHDNQLPGYGMGKKLRTGENGGQPRMKCSAESSVSGQQLQCHQEAEKKRKPGQSPCTTRHFDGCLPW